MLKTSRWSRLLLCAAVLAAWTPAFGADALSDQAKAQSKLLAYRAARADAIRKLAERIQGLQITSETKVQDFVASSDTIRTAMTAWLSGMKEVDKPQYAEDGTCTVTMEVPLSEIVFSLEHIYKTCYKGDKIKLEDFKKIEVNSNVKIIRETGAGAPRPVAPVGELQALKEGQALETMGLGQAAAYWKEHVTGQGRLMAVRAARVEGMRRLGERIKGVVITSNTTVQDFVAQSDQVDVDMRTFLRGAREAGIRYHVDEPIVEVVMAVTLRTVYAELKTWTEAHYKGDKIKVRQFDELIVEAKDTVIEETGSGVPPATMLKDVKPELVARAQNVPDWAGQTKRAVGSAAIDAENINKAQAKLMAQRGAELDARRKLAEEIHGLRITSNTSVKDFVAANDEVRTALLTFQQGAHVVEGSQKFGEDGTVTVTVEIDLRPLWDTIIYCEKKWSITIK